MFSRVLTRRFSLGTATVVKCNGMIGFPALRMDSSSKNGEQLKYVSE
jgi:hypothetical protein